MNKHTPGPWSAERKHAKWNEGVGVRYIDAPDCKEICTLYGAHGQQGYANSRLIAAAPDLLEAAQRVLAIMSPEIPGSHGSPMEDLRAAIAKATGAA